jgi:D-inositol-3-phosphate glycosyltransferase
MTAPTGSVRRVAVIAYHSSPLAEPGAGDAGGMTVYVRALARALADRGVNTDIYTRATTDIGRIVHMSRGVRVVSIEAGPVGPIEKGRGVDFISDFADGVRAFALTQRMRYDVVHSHYWQSGLAARSLALSWGAPLVHSLHTLGQVKNLLLGPGDEPEPQRRLDGEADVIAAADVVVASTDNEWQQLSCLYGAPHDSLKTLHPGVDHSLFSPGSRLTARATLGLGDGPVLLYAGRIQRLKGLDLALESLGILQRDLGVPATLVIVGGASGSGGEKELLRLKSLAAELGLEGSVRFVGPQPHAKLPDFYRASNGLVVCSYSESFGLTALEAHACAVPVVATSVGGLSHVVVDGESGFLIDDRDPTMFAKRLHTILADEDVHGRMARAATRRAAAFSWDVAAQQFHELYECLVREEVVEACTC